MTFFYQPLHMDMPVLVAQSAEAVEYTNCTSAEG